MGFKIYICIILLNLFGSHITAQDLKTVLPSQPDRNMVYLNPAFTGFYETTVFSLLHRSLWMGFSNTGGAARMFQNVEFHAPLKKQSIALGGLFRHSKEGASVNNEAFANYSHRIVLGNKDRLAFGFKFGAIFKSLDQDFISENGLENDPAFAGFENKLIPNAGFGLAYYGKNYYGGISIPYLLSSNLKFDLNALNFLLSGGGRLLLIDNLLIQPSTVLVYNLASRLNYQVNLNFYYKDLIMAGAGYRGQEAIIFTIGYSLNYQLSFQYSYDYNIQNLNNPYSKGSHEISLLYYFSYKVNTVSPIDF